MLLVADGLPASVQSLLSHVKTLQLSSHAGKAHYELVEYLTNEGFFVECEHTIYLSQGGVERIDIMAHRDEMILAIEVDARFKRKSVQRLRRLKDAGVYLIICLLHPTKMALPDDIDAIVALEGDPDESG